jgi:hypothetical protein
MIDVMMSVEIGRGLPVCGSHSGPESDAATTRKSSNQNLCFAGGFSAAGNPAASRAFRRRRCKAMSGMKQAIARIGAIHSHVSDRPSGLLKIPSNRNKDPADDKAVCIFEGFMRSNEKELSHHSGSETALQLKID